MLQRGFTTVRDAGGADWGLAAAMEYGLIAGPRVFYAGRALSQTGGHGDFRSRTLEADQCACCMSGIQFSVIADGVPEVQRAEIGRASCRERGKIAVVEVEIQDKREGNG